MSKKSSADDPLALQEFVKLMTDHQWALRGYILSLMPGSPEVGDVLQETNLVLWRKRKQFEFGTNFMAWASSIARYEVFHQRDRTRKHRHLPFSDELVTVLADRRTIDKSQEARLQALEGCLGKLSDRQRQIVEQRYTPGRSLEAHAVALGTSAGSLRVTLHRIRKTLKTCVQSSLAGEPL